MAKLSDEDMRVLHGSNYDAHQEREAIAALNSPSNQIDKWQSWKFNAVAVILLGLALIAGGFWLNGPVLGAEKMVGIAAAALGAVVYFYSRSRIGKLQSEQRSGGPA